MNSIGFLLKMDSLALTIPYNKENGMAYHRISSIETNGNIMSPYVEKIKLHLKASGLITLVGVFFCFFFVVLCPREYHITKLTCHAQT